MVDLLKNSPHCRLPFTKFIPEYHHHFGRQCRVADYGYTKLIELFEAIPHIMQVMFDILCMSRGHGYGQSMTVIIETLKNPFRSWVPATTKS